MRPSYKWLMLALLAMAFFFHQADRVLFGLLTIPIQNELHLDDLQIGWINTSLFCTLAVATPLAGFLGDRVSRKWIITASLVFWSLMTACTGLVGGMCGLVFFRSIATGGGESFYAPSAYALIAAHHRETRSVALSIHQSALYMGLMFSGALVAYVLHLFGGWRPVFFAFGGMGLLLGLVFVFALKDGGVARPVQKRAVPVLASVKAYFGNPAAMLATAGFVAVVFANNAYLSWAPKYMARRFELSVGDAGGGTMLYHHVAALVAILCGAALTDAMVRRHPRFRLALQAAAFLLGAPTLVYFGFAPSVAGAWGAVAAYGVFRGLVEVNTHASLFDVIPAEHRSSAAGMMTMMAFFVGSLSPLMIGALSKKMGLHGFEIGFAILGGAYLVGAACVCLSFFLFFRRWRVVEPSVKEVEG